jgi:cobalamin biosynthetic protein CobC
MASASSVSGKDEGVMAGPDDSQASLDHHGGNLDAARRRFPAAREPWIDLSTGINAVPYPIGAISAQAWTRLPEPAAIAALEAAAAARYGASPARVIAAPGTQALIQILPRLIGARSIRVLGFTYAEHAAAWRAAGADVGVVEELTSLFPSLRAEGEAIQGLAYAGPRIASPWARNDGCVAVVVNPNNPDGRLVGAADLRALAGAMAERGGVLIVDEAFMDVVPGQSLIPTLPERGAIVLRSFGKTYGLAGLRLGFAVASPDWAPVLRVAIGPWAASGPAIEIGIRALADSAWLEATIARLGDDAGRLDALLAEAGFSILGGCALYRLAAHEDAAAMFERLGNAAILVRSFADRPHWLRFGIPHEEAHWARLKRALAR